jgi:hypothetical protein
MEQARPRNNGGHEDWSVELEDAKRLNADLTDLLAEFVDALGIEIKNL